MTDRPPRWAAWAGHAISALLVVLAGTVLLYAIVRLWGAML